jgi:predicted nucleic acid-binding Zn ribbon protein
MGFNPHRKRVRRPSDVLMVAAALLIVTVLVLWAFVG